ncbi:hypothetical protein M378DRAFT_167118 [Amanita muscaria Koide BX008]|uniref:Uncharacterized protein n=1 Tax=Amanita muscaria (strain Koide BX008) TaxID=946122 RepID=A0A0C2WWV4_AMAMK|nr:hypothetical protein M378DRAFT_167118 [Amanita muscaria Koide BX008]
MQAGQAVYGGGAILNSREVDDGTEEDICSLIIALASRAKLALVAVVPLNRGGFAL